MALVTMGSWFGDAVGTVTKVVTAPVWLPIKVSADAIKTVAGGAGAAVGTAKDILGALRPPPPPPPPSSLADVFGLGGSDAAVVSRSSSSSSVPIILGGVAVVGLVLVAVLGRKKKGRRS
jgi:hypothetical protein